MGIFTRGIVALVVVYIAFFTFKLSSLLFPQAALWFADVKPDEQLLTPAWPKGTKVEAVLHLVNTKDGNNKRVVAIKTKTRPVAFVFNDQDDASIKLSIEIDEEIQRLIAPGATLRITLRPSSNQTLSSSSLKGAVVQGDVPIVVFRHPLREKQLSPKRNLVQNIWLLKDLFPRSDDDLNESRTHEPAFVSRRPGKEPRIAFLLPRVTAYLVADWTEWPRTVIPDHIAQHLRVSSAGGVKGTGPQQYLPLLSTVQMGVKQFELVQINQTHQNYFVPLEVHIGTTRLARWAFHALMHDSFELHRKLGMIDESDMDDIRSLLTETSPELLLLTMVVSLIHLLFDALAFKSDLSFWNNLSTSEGLSAMSTGLSFIGQIIVTLYLQDQCASTLVLLPSYVGLGISLWKMIKLATLKRNSQSVPTKLSNDETCEADFEWIALKYMAMILTPAVLGYSFWTLVKDDHRSWYSWGITSLASCVYAGGFALMTPQIFLNYKLESVAHMDWPALWFRAFNTFIDDFFAYLIPMPGLARVAVLRDDLIFLIFLYQRWLYPARAALHENEEGVTDNSNKVKQE